MPANTFEGGSQGTTITTGNSGGTSGDAFNNVTVAAGTTLTYDGTGIKGNFGAKMVGDGVGVNTFAEWSTTFGTQTTFYGRVYWRWDAWTSGDMVIIRCLNGTTAACFRIDITGSTKLIRTRNASGTLLLTGTTAIPQSTLVRIEYRCITNATTGEVEARLWTSPESTGAADDTLLSTNVNTNTQATNYRIGQNNVASASTHSFDDWALGTNTWLGPSTVGGGAAAVTRRALLGVGV